LGKQIGFDIKERLSIPRPETVRKLFKLTQELAIKNKGPPESSAELSTQELLEDAKKQKLIKSLKKKKSELKQQTAALEDAVKALALTNAQQSEAETSGAENSGAQSSSARPKLTWEEIQADRRERRDREKAARPKALTTEPTQQQLQSTSGWLLGAPTQTLRQAQRGAGRERRRSSMCPRPSWSISM
jgi:hypothetical protein